MSVKAEISAGKLKRLNSGVIMILALSAILARPRSSDALIHYSQRSEPSVSIAFGSAGLGGIVQRNSAGGVANIRQVQVGGSGTATARLDRQWRPW